MENFSQGPPSDTFRKGNWEYLKIGEKKIENCKIVNSTPGQKEAIQIVQNITLKNENRPPERVWDPEKYNKEKWKWKKKKWENKTEPSNSLQIVNNSTKKPSKLNTKSTKKPSNENRLVLVDNF